MANTTSKGVPKKTGTEKKPAAGATKAKEKATVEKTAAPKKESKTVELTDLVKVVSCFYGKLVYISRKTGDLPAIHTVGYAPCIFGFQKRLAGLK